MKCKECSAITCPHRTTDGETECYYNSIEPELITQKDISKQNWISGTAVRLIESIPYEYVTSGVGGVTTEPRHI